MAHVVVVGPVLIVDDDAAIRTLVRTVLARDGYEVDEAADGSDALTKIAARAYAVIVLDLMMPKLSGYDVLEYLTKERPGSKCVVIMTAAMSKEIDRADQTPVKAILRKPFDLDELRQAVRSCFEVEE